MLLDNLDLAKKDKYLVGKGIKWLLILVPWLCVKIYNLFTKKGKDEGTYVQEAEAEDVVSKEETKAEEAQEESPQVTASVAEEQIDFIPANESKWSIIVTAIIVGSIILGGSYWMLKDKIKLHKPSATYSYNMGDEKKMSFEDGYYSYISRMKTEASVCSFPFRPH